MKIQELLRDDEMLAWVWAVKDQWHLYYRHDAMWIDCAAKGWRGVEDQFHSFLKAYGLLRGQVGKAFGDSAGIEDNNYELGRQNRLALIAATIDRRASF